MNENLKISDVTIHADFPFFVIYQGTDGLFHIARFKEIPRFETSNGKIYTVKTMNRITEARNLSQIFSAAKEEPMQTYKESYETRGFELSKLYACNFDIMTTENEVVMRAHGYNDNEFLYENTYAGWTGDAIKTVMKEEIVSLVPIVLATLCIAFSIRKGWHFLIKQLEVV